VRGGGFDAAVPVMWITVASASRGGAAWCGDMPVAGGATVSAARDAVGGRSNGGGTTTGKAHQIARTGQRKPPRAPKKHTSAGRGGKGRRGKARRAPARERAADAGEAHAESAQDHPAQPEKGETAQERERGRQSAEPERKAQRARAPPGARRRERQERDQQGSGERTPSAHQSASRGQETEGDRARCEGRRSAQAHSPERAHGETPKPGWGGGRRATKGGGHTPAKREQRARGSGKTAENPEGKGKPQKAHHRMVKTHKGKQGQGERGATKAQKKPPRRGNQRGERRRSRRDEGDDDDEDDGDDDEEEDDEQEKKKLRSRAR
jgi:hypothetical protein